MGAFGQLQFSFGLCVFMGRCPKVSISLGHGGLFMGSSQVLLYFGFQGKYVLRA